MDDAFTLAELIPGAHVCKTGSLLGLGTVVGWEDGPHGRVVTVKFGYRALGLPEATALSELRRPMTPERAAQALAIGRAGAPLPDDRALIDRLVAKTVVTGTPEQQLQLLGQLRRDGRRSEDARHLGATAMPELAFVLGREQDELIATLDVQEAGPTVPAVTFADAPAGPDGPTVSGYSAAGSFSVGQEGFLLGPSFAVVRDDPASRVLRLNAMAGRWRVYVADGAVLLRHADVRPSWFAGWFGRREPVEAPYGAIAVVDGARARDPEVRGSVPFMEGTWAWGLKRTVPTGTYSARIQEASGVATQVEIRPVS